ncbi:Gfo/Idh/MocA family protein [Sporocytophaga myxococcoides]|uniref:Gfo/Idh/MocA family protein n=1 Tax=Sporocytophaga myxococcoides TaxID=153721 RepID=UPI00048C50D7|nr:Gfo/Idh/MocA family oxidoreductase [Sporocytophaga myxococcoides]
MKRKIRMGMVGGGQDAFIGAVHRMAAVLDGEIELVCGAFSSSEVKSKASGAELYLSPDRAYASFEEMISKEKSLPEDVRMDFVSIVTPNFLHVKQAMLALENGFHVLCEKPLALSSSEALTLRDKVKQSGLLFGLMHNYTGYPMVKEAKAIVNSGKLGPIRKVIAEYVQGWLASRIEESGQKQADWRTDPDKAGISCCVGDIGTHAENLAEYITGLKISELSADVSTFVKGRMLDDDASVLLRFDNGAKGVLFSSQIAIGEENELKIRVYGEKGSIEWLQSEPNSLLVKMAGEPVQIYRTGVDKGYLSKAALSGTRLPGGHPEGYIESLANIYKEFARAIKVNQEDGYEEFDFPDIEDGVRGMRFIEAVIESGHKNAQWVKL